MIPNKDANVAPVTGDLVYRLKGKPLRRWWQLGDQFTVVRSLHAPVDKYQSVAIQSTLAFTLTLPFAMALMYQAAGQESIPLILIATASWSLLAIQMVWTYKQHCRMAVEVRIRDTGIRIKSPLMPPRNIHWLEIAEFFPIHGDDHILQTTSGEDFVLSSDLSGSSELFRRVNQLRPKQKDLYHTNSRLPNTYIDGVNSACLAIGIAVTFPLIALIIYVPKGATISIDSMVYPAVGVLIAFAFWKLHMSNVAELTRIGDEQILLRTRSGRTTSLSKTDIEGVKHILGFYFLVTSKGSFFTIVENVDAASAKLLELKNLAMSKKYL